jgi:hypothetical protein
VTNLRRLALASVVVGGLIGVFVKLGTGGFIPHKSSSINLSRLALGEKIGPFAFEGLVDRDSQYLQLRSTQCEGSIFMTFSSVSYAPPKDLTALFYPATEWRTLYVHRGQTYDTFDTFTRIPAYVRVLALRLLTAITLSAHDHQSEELFFSFRIPVGCALDRSAAIAASEAVIALYQIPEILSRRGFSNQ